MLNCTHHAQHSSQQEILRLRQSNNVAQHNTGKNHLQALIRAAATACTSRHAWYQQDEVRGRLWTPCLHEESPILAECASTPLG